MSLFRLFRLIEEKKNRCQLRYRNVSHKDYAITKMRSFAAFSFIAGGIRKGGETRSTKISRTLDPARVDDKSPMIHC